ncbi:helix-turn-helix domain-containing protein [Geothrix sp. PMB-07]|uniref:helix-turn-helix domain-containing protein n=1 Tax=Geothrix sp. PMB-07 TaxID=3068640 RepID=UPI002741E2B1|nr:helix-turn-helix transcriptional regulator [Geothrix sp. PMB-07]WLT30933.1 helix-turn-helix transcriptional regulator [Geothrix sp. PMB-07]
MENNKTSKSRKYISDKVAELRKERRLTQSELAKRLGLSQGRYSEIENGKGSFTAEQFLEILRIFNVPASAFVQKKGDVVDELQNALLRLGATHLAPNEGVFPSEDLEKVDQLIREVLVSGDVPRHLAALAPVVVRSSKWLGWTRLWVHLSNVGLEARLGWLAENTLAAVQESLKGDLSRQETLALRSAERSLTDFLSWVESHRHRTLDSYYEDLIGSRNLSEQTKANIRKHSSEISKRWHIISNLQPTDFLEALKAADVAR